MSSEIALADLLRFAGKSRGMKYLRKLIEALCADLDLVVVLTEGEEPPQVGDIPHRDTPTFRELIAHFPKDDSGVDGFRTDGSGRLEICCGGHPFIIHARCSKDGQKKVISLQAEADLSCEIPPGAKGPGPVTVSYPEPDRIHEYARQPLITIAEFKRRWESVKHPPWTWLGPFLLLWVAAIVGLVACGPYLFSRPSPWNEIVKVVAAIVVIALPIYLFIMKNFEIYRQHGMMCPYCGGNLVGDWNCFQWRGKGSSLWAKGYRHTNPFATGFCSSCRAEIIEPDAADECQTTI